MAAADELRAYVGYRRQGRPAAPVDQAARLRQWKAENEAANAQHLQDLSGMAMPWETPNPQQQEAQDRAVEHVAGGMNVGGLTAWHGSPHRFTKFDPSKIGTGEGAQAFGQGFYSAQRRGIAEDYRLNLSSRALLQKIREVGLANNGKLLPGDAGFNQLMKSGKLAPDEINLLTQFKNQGWFGYRFPHEALVGAVKTPDIVPMAAPTKGALKGLGNTYQLDIPDPMVAKMLDWDKPLYGQNRAMQQIGSVYNNPENVMLRRAMDRYDSAYHSGGKEPIAGNLMTNLLRNTPDSAGADRLAGMALARDLYQADIPGVRYLDRPSRNAGGGTSNFVVFPEASQKIRIDAINDVPINSWGGNLP